MMIIYTNKLIPKKFDSITLGTLILIRPEKRSDVGLLAHEQVHVAQFRRSWLFPLRYLWDADYRVRCEVEAYKVSIRHGMLPLRAACLLVRYKKGLRVNEALSFLLL